MNKKHTTMNGTGAPPAKKKREHPNKKWRESEVLLIIEFLQKEEEFESPTAQIYYKRFLKKSHVDATWDLVRWKVRHLKAQYHKAKDWLASTDAALLKHADARTIAKVAKMCPYFDKLREIFGKSMSERQPLLLTTNMRMGPLAAAPEQKITLEERKLQLEEKKYEWDREMEEKKLELEVKKMEMENRWKILAIEMKERVAKYEIDKKYANKN